MTPDETKMNWIVIDVILVYKSYVHCFPLRDVPREEVIDWIEINKSVPMVKELTDEQIIQSVASPQESQVQEVESDEERAMADEAKVSWKLASDALHTFIKFAESNQSYNSAELINLFIIRSNFLKKRSESRKQCVELAVLTHPKENL
ncbi:unnamed protein product [Timema podura]|uniref:Uncharacterized protein n=1 Tax=Timema podura TaxID=61482 RepID=A0ABN7NX33_TIMPD|nr:unnamed protein product [Timema podura]